MDFASLFDNLFAARATRSITFREAISDVAFQPDRTIPAGIRYREAGFDFTRGVLYPENRVEILIWLRDWFARSTDGATAAELQALIASLRGDIKEGVSEHYSRFIVDGATYKYDSHAFDERPDGVLFAVIVTLQAG